MEDDDCFLCGADDSSIELHEYDSPKMAQNALCCSECLTNGDADDYEKE